MLGALTPPAKRAFCKLLAVDNANNVLFFKGHDGTAIRWLPCSIVHDLFSKDIPQNSPPASKSLDTQIDDIRFIDVFYRLDRSFLLVTGETEIILYATVGDSNGSPQQISRLCSGKRIKLLRMFPTTRTDCIAMVSYEDHSIDVLDFLESFNSLKLTRIPIDDVLGFKIADACYVPNDDKLLILSPNDGKCASYELGNGILSPHFIFSPTSFGAKVTYFHIIGHVSSHHVLSCLQTIANERSLIVIDIHKGTFEPFEDPTFSLHVSEHQPPYFHLSSMRTLKTDEPTASSVSILLSSCSPDLCILYFNEKTNSLSVSIPSEDEDMATLPMIPTEESPFEEESDTFCTGLSVDRCCPWSFPCGDPDAADDEVHLHRSPFVVLLTSIGWIVGYSLLVPKELSVIRDDVPSKHSCHPNIASGENMPMPPEEQKVKDETSKSVKQPVPETLVMPGSDIKLLTCIPNAGNVDGSKLPHAVSIGSDAFDIESLALPKDSSMYKILAPIACEIKDVLELSSASLAQLSEFPSCCTEKDMETKDISSLAAKLSQKASLLHEGLKNIKPLLLLVADMQQLKCPSMDDLTSVKRKNDTSIPMEALVDFKYTVCLEKVSTLEKKVAKLEKKLQILDPAALEPTGLAWQHRIQRLDRQTESIEQTLNDLDDEIHSKLVLAERNSSFSYGLSEEDCVVQLSKESSPRVENVTLWTHLLKPQREKNAPAADAMKSKPVASFLDSSFEEYEKETKEKDIVASISTNKESKAEDAMLSSISLSSLSSMSSLGTPICTPLAAIAPTTEMLSLGTAPYVSGSAQTSQTVLKPTTQFGFSFDIGSGLLKTVENPPSLTMAPISEIKKNIQTLKEQAKLSPDVDPGVASPFPLEMGPQIATPSSSFSFSFPIPAAKVPPLPLVTTFPEFGKQTESQSHQIPFVESKTTIEEIPTASSIDGNSGPDDNTVSIDEAKKIIELPDDNIERASSVDADQPNKLDEVDRLAAKKVPSSFVGAAIEKPAEVSLSLSSFAIGSTADSLKDKPTPFSLVTSSTFSSSATGPNNIIPLASQNAVTPTNFTGQTFTSGPSFGASSFRTSSFGTSSLGATSIESKDTFSFGSTSFGATSLGMPSFGTSTFGTNQLNSSSFGATSSFQNGNIATFPSTSIFSGASSANGVNQFAALASPQHGTSIFSTDNSETILAPFVPSSNTSINNTVTTMSMALQPTQTNKPPSASFTKFRD